MNTHEQPSHNTMSDDEAYELSLTLPEGMQTEHGGLPPEEPYFSTWEEAEEALVASGENRKIPMTFVVIKFKDGREISLHLDYKMRRQISYEAMSLTRSQKSWKCQKQPKRSRAQKWCTNNFNISTVDLLKTLRLTAKGFSVE